MKTRTLIRFAAAALVATCVSDARAQSVEADYTRHCRGCHGAGFSSPSTGGVAARAPEELVAVIRNGVPARGMPPFGTQLSETQIQNLARLIQASSAPASRMLGVTIEGETLTRDRSSGFLVMSAEQQPQIRFVGYINERSSICYDNINLTGARSIELHYAKGLGEPGRFAVLIGDGEEKPHINLGEKATTSTGGWEKFQPLRIGLDRELTGRHLLCFYGVKGGGILNLDRFTLSDQPAEHDGLTLSIADTLPPAFTVDGQPFVVEKVAETSADLWSMAFLSDGSIIATPKSGQLLLFKNGEYVGRIEGTPEVWNGGQGGLLHVKPHPAYAKNGWIYLTFSDLDAGNNTTMTRLVRGKLNGLKWVEQQDIYRAPAQFYAQDYAHFGSRIAFAGDHIYFSVGDRQQPELAQNLAYPYGKIHRLHDDGRVPRDNPFVNRESALKSIWSYGHRNPQGMTTHPRTSDIWSAEHGPMGGDEINLVLKGMNYGWASVSFGTHYDGKPVGTSPYLEGVEPPIHHFTPSIGLSQIEFYAGDKFPAWQDQLLAASIGREELHLVQLRDNRVMNDRLLFKGLGRIRDVVVGPDGYPYVLLNQFAAGIYRMRPKEE